MFHKEFYPTPSWVLDMMNIQLDGCSVLEPHGGKGDIISYALKNGAKEVYFSEIVPELAAISASKGGVQIGEDFLKIDELPPVDVIVMNPPFSNADKHILHAFDIAKPNTMIYALCNWATIEKSDRYSTLAKTIKSYGCAQNLGNVFSDAERKTEVETGFVELYKPAEDSSDINMDFYMFDAEGHQDNGLIKYNYIRDIVQRHVGAVKQFDRLIEERDKLNELTGRVGMNELMFTYSIFGQNGKSMFTTPKEFIRKHRRASWDAIFKHLNMGKFMTRKSTEKLHAYMESRNNFPFTFKQVHHVCNLIFQTAEQNLNEGLVDCMTKVTKLSYAVDDRMWKTNHANKLGYKFILEGLFDQWLNYPRARHIDGTRYFHMADFIKVYSRACGYNYAQQESWRGFFNRIEKEHKNGEIDKIYGKWHDFNIFEIKVFKKGTTHFKFKNKSDCDLLNKKFAEAFDNQLSV